MEHILHKRYTKEEVRLELAGWLLADLLRLSTRLGADAAHRALGNTPPAIPGRVNLDPTRMAAYEVSIHDIDIDRFPVGHTVMAMYDYAYEQEFPLGQNVWTFEAEMDLVEDLIQSPKSELYFQFLKDSVYTWRAGDNNWQAVPTVLDIARTRINLDFGDRIISARDLAILAEIDIKTVLNARFAKGEDGLSLEKSHADFYAEPAEARRWLKTRPNFRPTKFRTINATPGDHPESLNSLVEIGSFIAERWHSLGKTPDSVFKELEWSERRFDYLNGITGAPQKIDPRDCNDLARSLDVSVTWFTTQVMRNLFPEQMALLLKESSKALLPRAADQDLPGDLANRICQRVRFTLHDGTQMFPVRMKNRTTAKIAYRLSEGGVGGNTKEQGIEVDNEGEMIQKVCHGDMAVRLISADGKRQGLYRKSGRTIRCVELDGEIL